MFDISKFRGVISLCVNVAIAVAGALTAQDVAAALKDFGLTADQAVTALVALGSATAVVIGAVSQKLQTKEASVKSAVAAVVKSDPVGAPAVIKEAVAEAKAEVVASDKVDAAADVAAKKLAGK